MYEQSLSLSLKRSFIIIFSLISLLGYGYFAFAVIPPNTTLDPVTTNPTECSGPTPWNNADCVIAGSLITADNGLMSSSGTVGLGGVLGKDTVIDQNGHDFLMIGLDGVDFYSGSNFFLGQAGGGLRYVDGTTNEMWMNGLWDSSSLGGGIQTGSGYMDSINHITQTASVTKNLSLLATRNFISSEEAVVSTSLDGTTNTGWVSMTAKVGSQTGRKIIGLDVQRISGGSSGGLYILDNWQTGIGSFNNGFDNYISSTSSTEIFTVYDGNTTGTVARFTNGIASCTIDPTTPGGIDCSSDGRLKTNIQSIHGALDIVTQLNPVTYNWKNGSDKTVYGYIAQEVAEVFPEAVRYNENTDSYLLNYQSIDILTLKAVQELNLKVDMLNSSSDSISSNIFTTLKNWLKDAGNGIEQLFSKKIITEEVCVRDSEGETCLDRTQLNTLLENQSSNGNSQEDAKVSNNKPSDEVENETITNPHGGDAGNLQNQEISENPQGNIGENSGSELGTDDNTDVNIS